jgi:hypothetical protein
VHVRGRENVFKRAPPRWIQSIVGDAAGAGEGPPRGWQGYSANAVLVLRCWIAALGLAAQEIGSQTRSAHATRVEIYSPRGEQMTSTTGC